MLLHDIRWNVHVRCEVDGSLMGFKLTAEFMDYGPDLPGSEWKAMIILADDANDETRLTYHAVTGPEIMRRIRLSPVAWKNLRGVLLRKGLLEVEESGKKGRCAKYRIPRFAPAGAGETGKRHETHAESSPKGHESHAESAKYGMGSMTPTSQEHFSGKEPFFGGVAPATPNGSHSDDGIPAGAVTATKGSSQRKPKQDKSRRQLSDRVSPEDRAKCNGFISLLSRLGNDQVDEALTHLWDGRKSMWVSAYQEMRKKFGGEPLPRSYVSTGEDYIYPDTPRQARFMYEKALRFMSRDGAWHESLTDPLEPLMKFEQSSDSPPWAA